ncbi:MAG: hypothetical protein IT429_04885 [Gemmataceae bacterium]|nr:hypothetical protein [Gemmataceae bacterium]
MSRTPRHPRAVALWLVPLAVWVSAGCSRAPDIQEPARKQVEVVEDPLAEAREFARKATEPSGYRDALQQVNRFLADHPDALPRHEPSAKILPALAKLLTGRSVPDAERQNPKALYKRLLVERVGLRDDELLEVGAERFTPLDAHYLEFCMVLRDAARSLRLNDQIGVDRLDQVRQAFDWVMRHVALAETGGPLEPPEFALRRGHGGGRERGLVFLALLAQIGVDGCAVAVPGDGKEAVRHPLFGALLEGKGRADVFLFDPRLGVPLPAPDDKGVATLAQLRGQPEKILTALSPSKTCPCDVTPAQAKQARVELVLPLSALSVRARFLEEDVFAAHDRVVLAARPERLLPRFEAAVGSAVGVWNWPGAAGEPLPRTPTGVLRLSLPPTEGGTDETQRYQRHLAELMPWAPVTAELRRLGITEDLQRSAGEDQIRAVIYNLYRQYIQVPREQLVRGRLDEASGRLGRLQVVLGEYDDALSRGKGEFEQNLREWRERVKAAAVKKVREGDVKAWEAAFGGDEYLGSLLRGGEDEADRRKLRTGMLGHVVFQAAGPTMRKDVRFLQALRLSEKAVRLEARLQASRAGGQKPGQRLERDVLSAWENAQSNWGNYAYDYPLSSEGIERRVKEVREHQNRGEPEQAVATIRYLFRDLRRSLIARLYQAEAAARAGHAAVARQALASVQQQAEAAVSSAGLDELRKEFFAAVQSPEARAALFGDLAPSGTVFWTRCRAHLEAARLAPGGG